MVECKLNICLRGSKTIEKKVYNSWGFLEFDRDEAGPKKIKFSIKDFFSKYGHIRSFLRI